MNDSFIFDFLKGFSANKEDDIKKDLINSYIKGNITKKQLDEKMQNLTIKSP